MSKLGGISRSWSGHSFLWLNSQVRQNEQTLQDGAPRRTETINQETTLTSYQQYVGDYTARVELSLQVLEHSRVFNT